MMNSNLDLIMKINGTKFADSDISTEEDNLSEKYNEDIEKTITKFDILVKTNKAINALIDGVFNKIVITYGKDGEKIIHSKENTLFKGTHVEHFKNEVKQHYLIVDDITDREGYQTAPLLYCNQTINSKKFKAPIPCHIEYLVNGDGVVNGIIPAFSGIAKLKVKKTDETKTIDRETRFVFNHSREDIYKVSDINAVEFEGIYELIMNKVPYMNEDDLENDIGYYPSDGSDEDESEIAIIQGNNNLYVGEEETYTINKANISFSLDNESYADIISQNGSSCVITAIINKAAKVILYAKDGSNNIIAQKSIMIYP